MPYKATCWHILVVDDDHSFIELVDRHLRKYDCTINGVDTCRQALDYIHGHAVDCVLMDQRLAGPQTGMECVKEIREASYYGSVIILTGFPEDRGIVAALNAGADDYIDKGKMLSLLYTSIKGAIEIRGAESSKLDARHQIKKEDMERVQGSLREARTRLDKLPHD